MIYIISDTHGNIEGLERALFKARITDALGRRQMPRNNTVISIGDLANCVGNSVMGDHECLSLVGSVIDYLIVGNHEMGYFDPENYFSGFRYHEGIHRTLRELHENDLVIPAWLEGDTLISHAGVSKSMLAGRFDSDAITVYERIKDHWNAHNYKHSFFSSIGHCRGGRQSCGGILWCDFHMEFQPTSFPQIVGHSSRGSNVKMKGNAICIDVGAKDPNGNDPLILEVR